MIRLACPAVSRTLLLGLLMMLIAPTAEACSCLRFPTAAGLYDASTDVIAAKVVSVTTTTRGESKYQNAVWKVLDRWKGPLRVGQTFNSCTSLECCVCGMQVVEGLEMIIYAHGEVPFRLSICAHSRDDFGNWYKDVPELNRLRARAAKLAAPAPK